MNTIDYDSYLPLHLQAEQILRQLIASDEYKYGKRLPPEMELAERLHISRSTIRLALNRLVYEGLIQRVRGRGTVVAPKKVVGNVKNWFSFSQEMSFKGIEVRNYELHVSFVHPTDEEICSFLGIDPSNFQSCCLCLERVRGGKDYPFVHFVSYFNPKIPLSGDENFATPLYEILEKRCGIVVSMSKEEIRAQVAPPEIAAKLGISANAPVLHRKRFVYDVYQRPVEYNVGIYRGDSFVYTLESER